MRKSDYVLVHGAGPIGLIVADVASSRGAVVIVSEANEKRLEMAQDFGADPTTLQSEEQHPIEPTGRVVASLKSIR